MALAHHTSVVYLFPLLGIKLKAQAIVILLDREGRKEVTSLFVSSSKRQQKREYCVDLCAFKCEILHRGCARFPLSQRTRVHANPKDTRKPMIQMDSDSTQDSTWIWLRFDSSQDLTQSCTCTVNTPLEETLSDGVTLLMVSSITGPTHGTRTKFHPQAW